MQLERSFSSSYRPISFTYDVKRDVYNEETFQQEHRRKTSSSGNLDIDITTFRHHVQCRCSWHKFTRCMLVVFPFLEWICFYRLKDWLLGDLLAGISVGLVQVPQGLTFSLLARQLIPPLNIAYAAFCSSTVYAILGSCHQMSIGFFFFVSSLMINVLKVSPFNSGHLVLGTFIKEDFSDPYFFMAYNRSLNVVASTTFLAGIIQLSMGMLGFGFIATYLPDSVINAYLAATALHIMLSQLTCIFGIMISFHAGPIAFFYNIINYCIALPKANSTSILLFLTVMVILRINKCIKISFNRYPIEFPMEFLLIIGFTVVANKLSMATESSKVLIEMIPYSFLFPGIPDMDLLSKIIFQAISLALVSSSLLIFLGKKFATAHKYKVNSNQDLIAIGLCNVISSFFRCCIFTGSVVRTVIQDKSGGRQQCASLVGAGVMLLLMVKVGHFFQSIPNAVLAGIILSNVIPYLETISNLPALWRQDQYDCIIWIMTFISALFLGLDVGLVVSVTFAFFIITVQSHRAKIYLLGQIPNTNIYRAINDYREITNIPGVKIFQCCNSITFVNIYQLKRKLLKEMDMIKVCLTEEDVYGLFGQSSHHTHVNRDLERGCKFFCNCDEPDPPPRVIYTEQFEPQSIHSSSSINLIRCSRLESVTSQATTSDEQVPYTVSSVSQRNQGQNLEEVEKVWVPNNPSRISAGASPEGAESQMRSRSYLPYSDVSLLPAIHTIILDFSMVHFVDPQASVILRQMCNAFQNANVMVLLAGCHSSVVRTFERNDFFDAGITKAQLFLTLHDAVLFALRRRLLDSELSVDESETVIQETHSEKNEDPRYQPYNSNLEIQKSTNLNYRPVVLKPEMEDSELEMEPMLESEQENELYLDLDLARVLEQESEVEPEMEPETELEPEADTETDPEPELKPRSKTLLQSPPYHRPSYKTVATRSIDNRHPHKDFLLSKSSNTEGPWEEDWM
ncbi:testis anion transporter 1 isoform X1 [Echinops telfairi]|uniref:Testis anion transporter 1 isoform X1 n=2 Tax=Echinops telfairi TaxID=9371 RepID=A0ABM0IYK8_ECHTE|nr:testis anion transporter 1 isoform X1 [Echinops telfairi]XP_045150857.1 testis anion transporter 1 isoform X1 [Echinops telfairi]